MANISFVLQLVLYAFVMMLLIMMCSIVFRSIKNGISPMPSNSHMQQAVIKQLDRLNSQGNIVDAGSGFGYLLFKLSKKRPNARYIGLETSLIPHYCAKLIYKLVGLHHEHHITFIRRDIYEYDYSNTDVIVCYLYPKGMQKLYEVLKQQHIKHIYIISVAFAINELKPIQIVQCSDLYHTKVYTYEIKQH